MTTTYTQTEPNFIDTHTIQEDGSISTGVVRRFETRTRTVQDGTEQVSIGLDEEGVEQFETQPKFIEESYSPWDELVLLDSDPESDISVTWLDEVAYQTEQDAIAAQQTFKSNRQSLLDNAVVTANNFEFDADEKAIGRMASALIAVSDELDTYILDWSLASTATGVMTTITKADLKLAHQLAVQNMANIWGV